MHHILYYATLATCYNNKLTNSTTKETEKLIGTGQDIDKKVPQLPNMTRHDWKKGTGRRRKGQKKKINPSSFPEPILDTPTLFFSNF